MTLKRNLVGSGLHQSQASAILGLLDSTLVAAGSTQATAAALRSDITLMASGSVGSGTGVIIPSSNGFGDDADEWEIYNYNGTNALLVYPPVGGTLHNGTANAGLSVATGKSVFIRRITPLLYSAIVSA
jgi:hypothetical protein